MRFARPLLAIAAALLVAACGGGDGADESSARDAASVPPPERFRAPEVRLEECDQADVASGYDVRVTGMTCADANRVLKPFTTAFSDENLRKPLVDRGNGWRCYQRLFGEFSVEEVCWRGEEQVLIFRK